MLHWQWKNKIGTFTTTHTLNGKKYTNKMNIYCGNCLAVICHEFKDKSTNKDMYELYTFFNDVWHLKRCLGLTRTREYDYETHKYIYTRENLLAKDNWGNIKLNTYYAETKILASNLLMAGFKVTLYYEKPKGE